MHSRIGMFDVAAIDFGLTTKSRKRSSMPTGPYTNGLITACKLIAPFVPFLAESLWQKLAVAVFGNRVPESVHLCDYPECDTNATDETLSARMNLVRHISSLGRQARSNAQLKVRPATSQCSSSISRHHTSRLVGRTCRSNCRGTQCKAG